MSLDDSYLVFGLKELACWVEIYIKDCEQVTEKYSQQRRENPGKRRFECLLDSICEIQDEKCAAKMRAEGQDLSELAHHRSTLNERDKEPSSYVLQ